MVKPASSPHFSSHLPAGKLRVGLFKNQPFLVVSLIFQSLSGMVYVNLLERSIIFFSPLRWSIFVGGCYLRHRRVDLCRRPCAWRPWRPVWINALVNWLLGDYTTLLLIAMFHHLPSFPIIYHDFLWMVI